MRVSVSGQWHVPIEVQLMRDWLPRSRPSPGVLLLGEAEPSMVKLFPGAAAEGNEDMLAVLEGATRESEMWARVIVSFRIDGMQFSEPRPTLLFLGVSDAPSGVVHFPRMALPSNKVLRGKHSVLLRCTSKEGK